MWRAGFGRGFGPVVRQITKWMNIVYHIIYIIISNIISHIICHISHMIYHIIYFHSVDPYRITNSIWICKYSYLLKKWRSVVNIKVYYNLFTRSSTILEVLT
jgi:hypothetical protein